MSLDLSRSVQTRQDGPLLQGVLQFSFASTGNGEGSVAIVVGPKARERALLSSRHERSPLPTWARP